MKTKALILVALCLTGCHLSAPDGRIIGVTSACIGINIGQSSADVVPHIQLGYTRSSFNIVPTGTNIFAPAVMNSMALDNTISHQQIDENFATGGATRDFNESAPATVSAKVKAIKAATIIGNTKTNYVDRIQYVTVPASETNNIPVVK